MDILKPTIAEVKQYEDKLQNNESLEHYRAQQAVLDLLYKQPTYKNDNLETLLLKVTVLNDFYSTNIFDTYSVAKHILTIPNLDQRLVDGDESLVKDIQTVTIAGKTKNFYSFATKFCSNHNPEAFPIYDRFVDVMLRYFRVEYKFSDFKNGDLKDYATFKQVIKEFQTYFDLKECSLREIDHYLWLLGKDAKENGLIKV